MPSKSQISGIVANLIGRLQGEIESRVEEESLKLLNKFSNQCPKTDDLVKVAKVRNNLLKSTNKILKIVNKIDSIPGKLQKGIRAAKKLIRLLKRNPTKLAIGNRPSFSDFDRGGLISTKTAGYTTTQADRLVEGKKLLEDLQDDLDSVRAIARSIKPTIRKTRDILENVNLNVSKCAEELEQQELKDEIQGLLSEIRPPRNLELDNLDTNALTFRDNNGRDYILSIIEDNSLDTTVPRRVAVAKDNIGVIVLRGQPSFSSDTQILLDELKFRINNQLP